MPLRASTWLGAPSCPCVSFHFLLSQAFKSSTLQSSHISHDCFHWFPSLQLAPGQFQKKAFCVSKFSINSSLTPSFSLPPPAPSLSSDAPGVSSRPCKSKSQPAQTLTLEFKDDRAQLAYFHLIRRCTLSKFSWYPRIHRLLAVFIFFPSSILLSSRSLWIPQNGPRVQKCHSLEADASFTH